MTKNTFLFFLILGFHIGFSQTISDTRISFGLRSHFGNTEAFSDVLDYYNTQRPWLKNNFSTSTLLNGFEIGLEVNYKKVGFSALKIYRVGTRRIARGTTPGGEDFKRTVRASIWGIELIDVWWTPLHIKNVNIGFGLMPVGFGQWRVYDKLNDEKKVRIPLSDLDNSKFLSAIFGKSNHTYIQPHIDFTTITNSNHSFHLQLFYSIGPKGEYDLFYLNKRINPSTYTGIFQRTRLEVNNFGLKLVYNI